MRGIFQNRTMGPLLADVIKPKIHYWFMDLKTCHVNRTRSVAVGRIGTENKQKNVYIKGA
jgi:hypothetical protein